MIKNNKLIKLIFLIITIVIILIIIYVIYNLNNTNTIDKFTNNTDNTYNTDNNRIAFLFLTRNNLKQSEIWNNFLKGNEARYSIYCHAKEPQKVTDKLLKDNIIPEYINTSWGDTVEANILLMKNALLNSQNNKFILVSESCIPISSFDTFHKNIMSNDKTIISILQENLERYQSKDLEKLLPVNEFTKNWAQGIVFSRYHTKLLVDSKDKYLDYWKNIRNADEHYFSNMLRILDKDFNDNHLNAKLTFDQWELKTLDKKLYNDDIDVKYDKCYLCNTFFYVSDKFLELLRNRGFLFIRKVNENTEIKITN